MKNINIIIELRNKRFILNKLLCSNCKQLDRKILCNCKKPSLLYKITNTNKTLGGE